MPRKRLSGRVDPVEGRGFVEIAIAERLDRLAEEPFDGVEVAEEFLMVEGVSRDGDLHAPVVAMETLAHAAEHDRVRCGEGGLYLDRVVGWLGVHRAARV